MNQTHSFPHRCPAYTKATRSHHDYTSCAVRDAKGTSGQVKGMYLTVHMLQQHGQSIGKVISLGFPKVIQLIMPSSSLFLSSLLFSSIFKSHPLTPVQISPTMPITGIFISNHQQLADLSFPCRWLLFQSCHGFSSHPKSD